MVFFSAKLKLTDDDLQYYAEHLSDIESIEDDPFASDEDSDESDESYFAEEDDNGSDIEVEISLEEDEKNINKNSANKNVVYPDIFGQMYHEILCQNLLFFLNENVRFIKIFEKLLQGCTFLNSSFHSTLLFIVENANKRIGIFEKEKKVRKQLTTTGV